MNTPLLVLLIVGVVIVTLLLRSNSKPSVTPVASDAEDRTRSALDEDDDEEPGDTESVPITAEGQALIPGTHVVRVLHLLDREFEENVPEWLDSAMSASQMPYAVLNRLYFKGAGGGLAMAHATVLGAGDFTGARIRPGIAGSYAARLETLGRDGEFGFFPFASEQGAQDALQLLESRGIVKRPVDDSGEAIPPSEEDFEEARRRYEQSERELALDQDEWDPGSQSWSDRR